MEFEFDAFLSHNGYDKPLVRKLKWLLNECGLKAWLDEDELRPGINWQPLLEAGVRSSKSIVVLIGPDGLGPWENEEMQGALKMAVQDKRPIIPTLLPGCPKQPDLPLFLGNRTWVDLRDGYTDAGIYKLVWGITGQKPNQAPVVMTHQDVVIPEIKQRATGRDKDLFLREAFSRIRSYFGKGCREMSIKYPDVEIEVEEIHKYKFICGMYRQGEIVTRCKIWLGGLSSDSISFVQDRDIDINNDNHMNDWLAIEDSGSGLGLRSSPAGIGFSGATKLSGILSADGAAEYLWLRAIDPLKHM